MTTRINITVDQSGLLDQVANQTRANHEALVIKQEQKKVEEVGSKEVAKKRSALGQDIKTGELLPITPPPSSGFFDINGNNGIGQHPAANRGDGGAKWIFDYSDLLRDKWDRQIYYRGTFRDRSRRLGYVLYGVREDENGDSLAINLRTSSDVRGAFVSEAAPTDRPRLITLEAGTPNDYNLLDLVQEAPSRPFNKISLETWCYTPRPNIPDQLPEGQSPYINYSGRSEIFRFYFFDLRVISEEEMAIDFSASFEVFINRLSDNFLPSTFSPTQDSALLAVNGYLNGQAFQNYIVADLPMLGALETYALKIVYDGTTGILQVSINGINAINQFTGFTLSRQKYSTYLSFEHSVGTVAGGQGYMRPEPPIKMYKGVYTFS